MLGGKYCSLQRSFLMFTQYSEEFELIRVHDVGPEVNSGSEVRNIFVLIFYMDIQPMWCTYAERIMRFGDGSPARKQGLFANI